MPAETPRQKTKPTPKITATIGAWLVIMASIITLAVFAARPGNTVTLRAGMYTYDLHIAKTIVEQEKGLGGRANLPINQGMLFEFDNSATRCFWMKDMHFSLDMIWLNSVKKVEHIESNVAPTTYPRTFCPSQAAQYVIELNAGQAKAAGITAGQILNF